MKRLLAYLAPLLFPVIAWAAPPVYKDGDSVSTAYPPLGEATMCKNSTTMRAVGCSSSGGVLGNAVEDEAETAGGTLFMSGSVRRDTPASSAGTTGDNATLNTDATGKLWVTGTVAEDSVHFSGDVGVEILGVYKATPATMCADGDYCPFTTTNKGALYVDINSNPAESLNAGTNLLANEDAASGAGHTGAKVLVVRDDALAAGAETGLDGDFTWLRVDNYGAFWTDAIPRGDLVANSDDLETSRFAVINVDGADSDSVVSAVASKKIKVLGYTIVCDGATTITFEDGDGTDVTGAMALAANGGISAAVSAIGQFITPVVNKSLNILKSAAVNCDGHLTYVQSD